MKFQYFMLLFQYLENIEIFTHYGLINNIIYIFIYIQYEFNTD